MSEILYWIIAIILPATAFIIAIKELAESPFESRREDVCGYTALVLLGIEFIILVSFTIRTLWLAWL